MGTAPGEFRTLVRLTLFEDEIDTLARLEHARWCEERRAAGWLPDRVKDAGKRRSPDLVPWDALGEADKAYNRELARRLPAVLAKVDYTIRRVGE